MRIKHRSTRKGSIQAGRRRIWINQSKQLANQEDRYKAIEQGHFPKLTSYAQAMPEKDTEKTSYNPFDLTKMWPHGDNPLIQVGELEMHRNLENYFQMVDNAAYSPSNLVPGIGFSPD